MGSSECYQVIPIEITDNNVTATVWLHSSARRKGHAIAQKNWSKAWTALVSETLGLLLFTMTVLAVTVSTAAAQCSASGNPATPPPITGSATGTLKDYVLDNTGIGGCDGTNKQTGTGGTGYPGTPSAAVTADLTNITTTGSSTPLPFFGPIAVTAFSMGGVTFRFIQGGLLRPILVETNKLVSRSDSF